MTAPMGASEARGSDALAHSGSGHHHLYVIRHGATEWSVSGRHTGRTDIPLTDTGREQARQAGKLLAGTAFARVLVSPARRARETCELVGYGDVAEVTEDLWEWDYGDYEGVTTAEIRATVPAWTVWDSPVPGGETLHQVAARADRVIERVRAVDGDCAVFAHGHILRVLTARWCQLPPEEGRRFILETATVSVLAWEHEYPGVLRWNARA